MEKGIEAEESNLYKKTDKIAENVMDKMGNISSNVNMSANLNSQNNDNNSIDYNKMANAMLSALTGCKFTLDEDGFAKIVKDELYKVV